MTLLFLDALPPRTRRGTIVRLLIQVGKLTRQQVGRIEIQGRRATIEVPSRHAERLVRLLDGSSLANQFVRASLQRERNSADGEETHFDKFVRLLELEGEAEARQAWLRARKLAPEEAERRGHTLLNLRLREEESGLGGRWLMTFGKANREESLPWTRLTVGSPVVLSNQESEDWAVRGVVSQRESHAVQIALESPPDSPDEVHRFRLDQANDEIALQRQREAMERAENATDERLVEIRKVLLGEVAPQFATPEPLDSIDFFDPSLNDSQKNAVQLALSAEDVALIHGPPGTGKTTTVVELIRQAVRRKQMVLATAPSNIAVDNLFERLLNAGERVVRLGHPARVLPELREHTLDLIVESHDDVRLARELYKEAEALQQRTNRRSRSAANQYLYQRELRQEVKRLRADARRLEAQAVQQVINSADILCVTTTGMDAELLGKRTFDLAVVDEACQSVEPGCWIPLLRANKLILAGDPCQLPPTIVSDEAQREGFGISLPERLLSEHGTKISQLLEVQYRMHESIMAFSSREFYEDRLQAAEGVGQWVLADLAHVERNEWTTQPLLFIDTVGAGYDEEIEPEGESKLNPQEAQLVKSQVEKLLAAGLLPAELAVIAPYAAQVRYLRNLLGSELRDAGLEIDSIDGFQGREKEAIVLTCVRSNKDGEIGFLKDARRMNVALTRARRKLIVIGDSGTLGGNPFYQRLLESFEAQHAYHSVWEEISY
ncbi:P-loop containing nucleoside triphosphate hydrolase [Planctomycetales bacterium 10988]|nr:P-loop containing nucleoside triphosphate hydrolase [Planctomycetales bacterium 10988]